MFNSLAENSSKNQKITTKSSLGSSCSPYRSIMPSESSLHSAIFFLELLDLIRFQFSKQDGRDLKCSTGIQGGEVKGIVEACFPLFGIHFQRIEQSL